MLSASSIYSPSPIFQKGPIRSLPQFHRHFTLEEAQSLVPWVRSVFDKVHRILDSERQPDEPLPFAASVGAHARSTNGASCNGGAHAHVLDPDEIIAGLEVEEKQTLLRGLVKALIDRGIVIQDVRRGLIDFPAWKDDKEVLLCYELNDGESIRFWHEVDAGFAGRQEIEDWP